MSDLGERLRELRESLGFSRAQWAARLGVSRMTVHYWEDGGMIPSAAVVERIVEGTGLPKSTVALELGLTDPEKPLSVFEALDRMKQEGQPLPRYREPEPRGEKQGRAFGDILRRRRDNRTLPPPSPSTTAGFLRGALPHARHAVLAPQG